MNMYDVFKTLKARGYMVNTCPIYPDDPDYGYLDACVFISRRDQEKFPFHRMVMDCLLPDYRWWDHYARQEVTPEEVLEFSRRCSPSLIQTRMRFGRISILFPSAHM